MQKVSHFKKGSKDYQNFIPIFNRTKAIGYIDGLEPHVIAEGSNTDRLTEIYNIVTHNRDVIHENQDYEKVINLRDTEQKAWFLTKDGKKFLLDFTKDEDIGAVKNFFGWLLPGIDSRKQLLNRKRIEKELHALGLTTEKAENLREHIYRAATLRFLRHHANKVPDLHRDQ